MSKKKLAKDALKSFLKTVKKIKSFDLKKTFTESGNTFSKLSIIVKHKTDKVPEIKVKKKKSEKKKTKSSSKSKTDKAKVVKSSQKLKPAEKKVSPAKAVAVAKPKPSVAKSPAPKAAEKVPETKTVLKAKTAKVKAPAVKVETKVKATPAKAPVKRAPRKPTVGDNLKLIEGIGPKIESFLKEDGIDTFEKLAKAIPEEIQKMLVAKGGTRYNANNPATWPEQASLAAKGDMEALNALKLELKGGRRA